MRRVTLWAGVLVLAVAVTGCQSLNEERTADLTGENTSHDTILPAISGDQKVKVTFESEGDVPVNVYAFTGKNKPKDDVTPPKETLWKLEKTAKGTGEFTVPAKEELYVRVAKHAKSTKVKVKLTN